VQGSKTDDKITAENFIPIREVRIASAKMSGDNLVLWVETGRYLSCDDYQAFQDELRNKVKVLPPNKHSFVAQDVPELRSAKPVDTTKCGDDIEAWNTIVAAVADLEVYRNAVFYRVLGIKKDESYIITNERKASDEPQRVYTLTANETYELQIHYSLPPKQFDLCNTNVEISGHDWFTVFGDCSIQDRVGNCSLPLKSRLPFEEYPKDKTVNLPVSVSTSNVIGPHVNLPILIINEKWYRKVGRKKGSLFSLIVAGSVFFISQMFLSSPALSFAAATMSTLAVIVVTALVDRIKG